METALWGPEGRWLGVERRAGGRLGVDPAARVEGFRRVQGAALREGFGGGWSLWEPRAPDQAGGGSRCGWDLGAQVPPSASLRCLGAPAGFPRAQPKPPKPHPRVVLWAKGALASPGRGGLPHPAKVATAAWDHQMGQGQVWAWCPDLSQSPERVARWPHHGWCLWISRA